MSQTNITSTHTTTIIIIEKAEVSELIGTQSELSRNKFGSGSLPADSGSLPADSGSLPAGSGRLPASCPQFRQGCQSQAAGETRPPARSKEDRNFD